MNLSAQKMSDLPKALTEDNLKKALSKMLGTQIIRADFESKQLQGGTVGDVRLVTGTAETAGGEKLPYEIILKVQKKWERQGDPDSWRREYDLYKSDLGALFTDSLRWPECYRAEMNGEENETQLWVEYIDAISGMDLTIEMREQAAAELGRFQGRIYKNNPPALQDISCFTPISWAGHYYTIYSRQEPQYNYIRSDDCEIPRYLCQMLMDMEREAEKIYANVGNMPFVLCHRDFWYSNIFYSDGKIILLDWDCTGWGYMFEDIIQLITDETDVKYLEEYYRKFIPAYIKGISEYIDISQLKDLHLYAWKLLVIKFGYTLAYRHMNAKSLDEKKSSITALQKMYEMRDVQWN